MTKTVDELWASTRAWIDANERFRDRVKKEIPESVHWDLEWIYFADRVTAIAVEEGFYAAENRAKHAADRLYDEEYADGENTSI